jgi:hypothetical protein
MDIHELLLELISYNDILSYGNKLIEFSDLVKCETRKATIIKAFYEQMCSFALVDYSFGLSDPQYVILQGYRALAFYSFLRIPPYSSPVKSLNAIRSFGQQIISNFTEPKGKVIEENKIIAIMDYLDKEYNFSSKVFSDRKAAFLILNNSNIEFNSECFVGLTDKEVIQHLFLYHMKDDSVAPEGVFFHELGHALHARIARSADTVPSNIIKLLDETNFPGYKSFSKIEQSEILADVLCMGLMYNSPFMEYDPFKEIDNVGKEFFNLLTRKLLSSINR